MTAALLTTGATLYAIAAVLEKYVKKYHPEAWEELNRWGD